MSRNTKMKGIAAEGMADHYHSSDEDFNSEDEEIIQDILIHYQNVFNKKEVVKVLDKYQWVEDDAYDALDEILKKKEEIKNKPATQEKKFVGGGNVLVKKSNQPAQKEQKKENPPLQLNKKPSSSASTTGPSTTTTSTTDKPKEKAGEYIKIDRDVVKYNSQYPDIPYDMEEETKDFI